MRLAPIFHAIQFATLAHAGQFRKGTNIPYILHPLTVAKLLITRECPEHMIIAAILHDTVEDTPVTLAEIETTFGAQIAHLVRGLSEPNKSLPWEIRKQHTIDDLRGADMEVLVIACADKLDNIRATHEALQLSGEAAWERFARSRDKQRWYYEALVEVLRGRMQHSPHRDLFDEFATIVRQVFG